MRHDIQAARQFALKWHGDQMYGGRPYIYHLDAVAAIMTSQGALPWQICAAYLHDVLEDTACPASLVFEKFGALVLAWVQAVTGTGASRKERQLDIVRKLRADTTGAVALKLADRLANVRQCVADDAPKLMAMYRKDLPVYDDLFSSASPAINAELHLLLALPG
jgi:(p)ppGpp synthase/HD superfamily hydrolase